MDPDSIVLKLLHGTTLKRIRKTPRSLGHLEKIILTEFPGLVGKAIRVQYEDCDGDLITVTTPDGFRESLQQLVEKNTSTLKFTITSQELKESPATLNDSKEIASEISWDDCLKSIVQEELKHQKEALDNVINNVSQPNHTVHENIKCSNCGIVPIRGVRYRCTECDSYNLCEACEGKEVHAHHALLKLTKKQLAEASKNSKQRTGKHAEKKKEPKKKRSSVPLKGLSPSKKMYMDQKAIEEKKNEMMGTIIGDSTKEVCGGPGEIAIVPIEFRNSTPFAWPENTIIAKTYGRPPFYQLPISESLQPGKEVKLSIPIELPNLLGSYTIKLRLKGNDKYFGQTILILVEVHKESNLDCAKCIERNKQICFTEA